VDSLVFLAKGGESYVLRAEVKQPVEVVAKTVLPASASPETMTSILAESHLVKLMENKDFIVDIYEEIIEYNQTLNKIENYIVLIEQAKYDLSNIVKAWTTLEKAHDKVEYFSNEKLFYFIFKACEAVNYLHSQNLYYGDMKEANLLVFRDYSVKLGDFGISIKIDPELDPNEENYELKGVTPGYSLPLFEAAMRDDAGDMFSKNKLFLSDYYALSVTFNNIRKTCRETFAEEAKKDLDEMNRYKYDEESYFNRFLDELPSLNPTTNPLSALLDKYRAMVANDSQFILDFCD